MRHTFRKTISSAAFALVACAVSASSAFAADSTLGRIPDDTYFPDQWHLTKIRAPEAWKSSLGFEGVTIAIIDSGVDVEHPDLKENIWRNLKEVPGNGRDDDGNGYVDDVQGWDFVGNDNDPRPDISSGYSIIGANHGTVDAGIAAARGGNGKGIAGVAWQAGIMPLRALDSDGIGTQESVVRAVDYAVRNGAKIINLSFAGPSRNAELGAALRRAYDAGVFVVAAAGNAPDGVEATDLDRSPLYPVCADQGADENFVFGVAAVDEKERLAAFSNYGAGCVDVSAPATRMISTQFRLAGSKDFVEPYGGFYNGTSLAAAEVSGVVALIRALDYNLTPKQIANILIESSVKIDAQNPGLFGKTGRGRIDAAAAVEKTLALHRQPGPQAVATASLLSPGYLGPIVVTASGKGRKPEVRLFTEDGTYVRSFMAYPESFLGGVSVSTADFDGNSRKTIVAGALAGGSPHVRIFDINSQPLGAFHAYDTGFKGGVTVAAGDLDGDRRDEIVTGAGPGGGPHVRIFTAKGVPVGGFFPFAKTSKLGVLVAVHDLDNDGKSEIVTVQPGGDSLRVYDAKGVLKFMAALPGKAAELSFGDANADGKDDVLVRFAAGWGVPAIVAFDRMGGRIVNYDADGKPLAGGVPAKTGLRSVLFGSSAKFAPSVTRIDGKGAVIRFFAYESSFRGGVNVAVTK